MCVCACVCVCVRGERESVCVCVCVCVCEEGKRECVCLCVCVCVCVCGSVLQHTCAPFVLGSTSRITPLQLDGFRPQILALTSELLYYTYAHQVDVKSHKLSPYACKMNRGAWRQSSKSIGQSSIVRFSSTCPFFINCESAVATTHT